MLSLSIEFSQNCPKNKFLNNIGPAKNIENKSNISCFDYYHSLGDGCTDGKYFNKLMEYQ